MTKLELVSIARELHIAGYSKMNKEALELAIAQAQTVEPIVEQAAEIESPLTEAQQSVMFDLKRYANFTVYPHLKDLAPTSGQIRLVEALQRNFKCVISLDGIGTREKLSNKIHAVYDAINAGTVKPRTSAEVKSALENTPASSVVKPATKAQLDKITALEKLTKVSNTTVIRDTKIASEVIQRYISLTKVSAAQEVAMTTIDNATVKHSLLNAIRVYIKGLFA